MNTLVLSVMAASSCSAVILKSASSVAATMTGIAPCLLYHLG